MDSGGRRCCLIENNVSTSSLELSVGPELGNSLEYDSPILVHFCQDQMGLAVHLSLKMYFSIVC